MPTIAEINKIHKEFFNTGTTFDVKFRLQALKKLQQNIKDNEDEILDALQKDLNKSHFEGYETEMGLVYEELRKTIKNLPKWVKKKTKPTPIIHFLSSSYVYPEPYGNVLIMSPWNYPFQLTMIPLIGAIAAGNTVVVKPSEYSFNTAEIIEKLITSSFEEKHVNIVRGGRQANQSLLEQKFDYIFFTGSPSVGKFVMESASKYLTPITLELGGKSPCIVDETADIKLSAKRIVWGKFLNSGQTCIAPDYLIVHKSVKDELVKYINYYVEEFYGKTPETCDYYPKIINEKHFERLQGLMKDGNILIGGRVNTQTRQIAPTIIDNITLDSPIMKEEIFGPLFPILTFNEFGEVHNIVASNPKPLAFYLFTTNNKIINECVKYLSFGGGCINDTVMHIANSNLPFGGVGNSGMGQYHSKLTFDTFTHYKAVLKKYNIVDIPMRYPPFNNKLKLLKMIER